MNNLKGIAPLIAVIAFFSLITVQGIRETIDNWKLRGYYNHAVLEYGDTNKNRKIEEEEDEIFRKELTKDIQNEPGYESFNWRENTHIAYNPDAKNLLNLIKKYKPLK